PTSLPRAGRVRWVVVFVVVVVPWITPCSAATSPARASAIASSVPKSRLSRPTAREPSDAVGGYDPPVIASLWIILLPLWIVLGLALILGIFALLSRVAGGKYVRPIMQFILKVPLLGRGMKKASQAALE